MVSSMKYRDVALKLNANGCRSEQGKGSHVKWYCPCGQHMTAVPRHQTVSPGVVRDVISKMQCLPKGWLQ